MNLGLFLTAMRGEIGKQFLQHEISNVVFLQKNKNLILQLNENIEINSNAKKMFSTITTPPPFCPPPSGLTKSRQVRVFEEGGDVAARPVNVCPLPSSKHLSTNSSILPIVSRLFLAPDRRNRSGRKSVVCIFVPEQTSDNRSNSTLETINTIHSSHFTLIFFSSLTLFLLLSSPLLTFPQPFMPH